MLCCNAFLCGVIFQNGGSRRDAEQMDYTVRHPEFRYKTEFQSHEPEVHIYNHVHSLMNISVASDAKQSRSSISFSLTISRVWK